MHNSKVRMNRSFVSFSATLFLSIAGCSGKRSEVAISQPSPAQTAVLAATPTQTPTTPLAPTSNILFIIDSSGSMKAQVEGQTKMEIAKKVLNDLVSTLSPGTQAGLIAYGHRTQNDCNDIEELVPLGQPNADAFREKVNRLQPLGQTPIGESIKQAAQLLAGKSGKRTIILVSDGEETCNQDPCTLATQLKKTDIDFKIHVVGFGLDKASAKKQLDCIAQATGGTYKDARNAAELRESLEDITEAAEAQTNLIQNGSFEIGPEPGGSMITYKAGAADISGWRVTRDTIDYIGPGFWSGSDGRRSIDLDGTPGAGGVAQSFATTAGQEYVVTFDLAGNPGCAPPIKRLEVTAAGQSTEFSFEASGTSAAAMGWVKKTWRFKANASNTTLEFRSLGDPNGKCGPVIDNVVVVSAR